MPFSDQPGGSRLASEHRANLAGRLLPGLLVRADGVFAVSPRRQEHPSPGNPKTDGEASNPLGNEGLLPPAEKFPGSRQIADRVGSSDCAQPVCGRAQ